ncbi:hypothetical protein LDL77_11095 [Flagellimonas marinaquae]|uniref:hypothetical protein n=1 Tax=Flagellimonas TaxID=444459 RepID=UPI001CE1C7A8|nr:hypothetical protein [Muricauda sp. DH64]UBZ12440.1 hypothetical protein LDL77_11095 [Allomuricauda aquimarina]|tara:strand:+ start:402 stop:659 length:258 start_codon:yes stop_codon:yes gene_type:complete
MEEENKVDEKFKSAFNLGYRVAEELNLKTLIFENQEKIMPDNPMHLGMQQFIEEAKLSQNIRQNKSLNQAKSKERKKRRGKGLGL